MATATDNRPDLSIDGEHPLAPVCMQWLRKISLAMDFKHDLFGKFADEACKYYDGSHNFMWNDEYSRQQTTGFLDSESDAVLPMFRMTVNRAFEAVALFGPALYHQNPMVLVSTHMLPDIEPEAFGISRQDEQGVQQFQQLLAQEDARKAVRKTHASLMQTYSNWLQFEGDKKVQSRRTIDETIIKGMSTMWTEIYNPPGSNIKYPRSMYVSVDDIQVDPDAKYWEDVQWIARKCIHPVNVVEEEYGLPPGSLRGHYMSGNAQGDTFGSPRERSERERRNRDSLKRSHDLIEYWKIYSKNGFGDHLQRTSEINEVYSKYDFSKFGKFCYLVVAPGVPFPLNVPSNALAEEEFEETFQRVQWPIPFWSDPNCDGGWPMTRLYFWTSPDHSWPISLFKPVIGEMRFINWCMSFLADKVAQSSTTYLTMLKSAGAEIQKQLTGPNRPYRIIEVSEITGQPIDRIVSFLQAPNFSLDIWKMISEVMNLIDKRTGLTELIYGLSSRQIRSAREADIKEGNLNIRPDDMASKTEDFLSAVASKEMQAARWLCDGRDVQDVLGPLGANIWEEQMKTEDYDRLVRDYQFRIEAGSARKPNKATRIESMTQVGQIIQPILQQMAMEGNPGPWNAYITDMAKALDLDPTPYLVPPPDQDGPTPEQVEAQMAQAQAEMEQQKLQQEMQIEQQKAELEMQVEQVKAQLAVQADQQKIASQEAKTQADILKAQMGLMAEREKMILESQANDQQLEQDSEEHDQEMVQDQEVHEQELEQMKEKFSLEKMILAAKRRAMAVPNSNGSSNGKK